jgi:hypothetical protein
MLQIVASLTNNLRDILFDCNMFIVQATGHSLWMSVNDASRIIIDAAGMMLQIVASLSDDSRGIIYASFMFVICS